MNILKSPRTNNKVAVISSLRLHKDGIAFYTQSLFSHLIKEDNPDVYLIGNLGSEGGGEPGKIIPVWSRGDILSLVKVHGIIWSINPKIIHLQFHVALYGNIKLSVLFLLSIYIWKIFGKKVVVTYHSVRDYREEEGIIYRIAKTTVGFVYSLPDKIVLSSELLKNFLIDYYKINHQKIFVIPMGIPEIKELREDEMPQNDLINIFSPAFLRRGLMLEELLFAIKSLIVDHNNIRLYLVASELSNSDDKKSIYLSKIKELIKDLDLSNHVVFVTDAEIASENEFFRLISKSQILIYFHEAYNSVDAGSISIMNAVAFGKTIIVSDVPKFYLAVDLLRANGLSKLVIPFSKEKEKRISDIQVALAFALEKDVQTKVLKLFNELSEKMTWKISAEKLKSFYIDLL